MLAEEVKVTVRRNMLANEGNLNLLSKQAAMSGAIESLGYY